MSGIDAAILLVVILLEYTFRVWFVFRRIACTIGGVTRGARFASSWIGEGAAVVNYTSQSVAVIDLRS